MSFNSTFYKTRELSTELKADLPEDMKKRNNNQFIQLAGKYKEDQANKGLNAMIILNNLLQVYSLYYFYSPWKIL